MTFDERRIFTAVNADKVEVGAKVIVADNLDDLKYSVKIMNSNTIVIKKINPSSFKNRFVTNVGTYSLCYVVEPIDELKWTDLKIGDIICCDAITEMVIGIDSEPKPDEEDGLLYHICVGSGWTSDEELKDYKKLK